MKGVITMIELKIKFIGKDYHNRDVYETSDGKILKNISYNDVPSQENLCTSLYNNFDGEPDIPLKYKTEKLRIIQVKN